VEGNPPATQQAERELIGTMAVTQDGIPISCDLLVDFMLSPGHAREPRRGNFANLPPYEYFRDSVERAVYLHTYSEMEDIPWTEIPLMLVVDLWREQIKERRLDDLIGKGRIPADELRKLERTLLQRLTEATAQLSQGNGTSIEVECLEFQLLKDRGIRILDVRLPRVFLPTNIRKERLRAWQEEWAGEIQLSLRKAEQDIRRTRQRAVIDTSKLLAGTITRELQQQLDEGLQIDWTEALAYLLQGTIQASQNQDLFRDELQLSMALRRIRDQILDADSGSSREIGPS
jgi:hypothetical protein